jgi:phage-related minor tail protein
MAEATFTLRAVDSTRAAFASVQNSLTKIHSTAKAVSTGIASFFGLRALLSVGRSVNAMMEDVEANSQKFALTSDELNKLTRVTGAVDQGVMFLKKGLVFAADAALNLKDQIFGVSKVESFSIADKIRADKDVPKIAEATKQLEELKNTFNSLGQTTNEKFKQLFTDIGKIQARPNDPAKSSSLNSLEKEVEVQKLVNEWRVISFNSLENYNKAVEDSNKVLDQYNFSLLNEKQQQAQVNAELTQLLALRRADEALIANRDTSKKMLTVDEVEAIERMLVALPKINELIGKRKVLETDLQIIARKSGDIIASGFEDAIFSGKKLGEVIRSLGMDLMRMIFNQTVTAPLAAGISGAILKGFRAEGGPVGAGGAYMVGEKGPELFVPHSSGSIVPNGAMGSSGKSAGGVTVNYNIASGVSRAELVPILEQERRRLKAEIPDMVRRGGSYRSAFA